MSSYRRIRPEWLEEAEANPLFVNAPIVDGGLTRQNTMIIEDPTTDSDTDIEPDTMGDAPLDTMGYIHTVGENGVYRPNLYPGLSDIDTDSDDDDGLIQRKSLKRLPAQGPKKRKAAQHVIEIDQDDDEELFDVAAPQRIAPEPVGRGAKAQRWCGTWNNPTMTGDEFVTLMESKEDVKMGVMQKEEGENGTPHFQLYFETKKRMYTTGVHAMLAPVKMSLLHAKGTKQQNEKYCTKEDGRTDGPWYFKCNADDFKRKNGNQGKRSDLDEFAMLVREEGGINKTVIEAMPGHAMAYSKHAKNLMAELDLAEAEEEEMLYWGEQARLEDEGLPFKGQRQRKCIFLWGPTGSGKTTKVKMDVCGRNKEKLYEKPAGTKWWDGYKGQKNVLIDEYVGKDQTIDEFKALTNIGQVQIEGKGTMAVLRAENLFYTSNRHPTQWWKRGGQFEYHNWNSACYRAVARRFDKVYWWNDAKVLTILENPGEAQNTREWKRKNELWKRFWEWRAPNEDGDNYFTL